MALKLNYTIGAEVRGGGPKLAVTADIDIQGYSFFQVDVDAQSTQQVDLHLEPPETIQALIIACDQRDKQVTFTVPGGAIPPISLAVPQALLGDGAKLLGEPPPYLELRNDLASPATVRIIVARTVEASAGTGPATPGTPSTPLAPGAPATPEAPGAPAGSTEAQRSSSKKPSASPPAAPDEASPAQAPGPSAEPAASESETETPPEGSQTS